MSRDSWEAWQNNAILHHVDEPNMQIFALMLIVGTTLFVWGLKSGLLYRDKGSPMVYAAVAAVGLGMPLMLFGGAAYVILTLF